jgi:hypothetical protein
MERGKETTKESHRLSDFVQSYIYIYISSLNKFVTWVIPTLLVGLSRKMNRLADNVVVRMHQFYWKIHGHVKLRQLVLSCVAC